VTIATAVAQNRQTTISLIFPKFPEFSLTNVIFQLFAGGVYPVNIMTPPRVTPENLLVKQI